MFLMWQIVSPQRRPSPRQVVEVSEENNSSYLFCETDNGEKDIVAEELQKFEDGLEMDATASSSDRHDYDQTLMLNVKYRHISNTVKVATNLSIGDLKATALQKLKLLSISEARTSSFNNYRLVYCGCTLEENVLVQDLNLENESNLHMIKIDPTDTLQLSTQSISSLTPSDYFIYCPICKSIQASKLRTQCLICHELNSFLIDRDNEPKCREDVLACPIVKGQCSSCHSKKAKFIFHCKQRHTFADSVPLKHIRNNARRICCITCVEVHTPVIVFPCDGQHTMCLNCFKIYCVICLNERRFQQTEKYGYTLRCPAHCPNSHIQEAHHFHVLGTEEYERYKNFGTEEFVLKEGGVLCPNPKCGQGLMPETDASTINCFSCQYEFCRHCSCDSHLGECGHQQPVESSELSSLPSSNLFVKCQWEKKSLSLIAQITKLCPKCKVKTEKNGGCNHMYCSRCQEEWCWICVKSWNRSCMEDHWLD